MESNTFASFFNGILSEEEIQLIRRDSHQAENNGKLSPEVLSLIYRNNWLKIMEPASCGGTEWYLPKVVRLFEALAYADGNVGWCVNLGAGANLFSGYFSEEVAGKIFTDKHTWCAGSGATSGIAQKAPGGFIVSGRWKYASGSAHASHFTANATFLDESGKPIFDKEQPAFRSFIFPAKEVTVLPTWNVSGLKASSSNDFEVSNVFVPESETFSLLNPSAFATAAIFQFPFEPLAVVNMACMATGMALHFLELFQDLMKNKTPIHGKEKLGKEKIVLDTYQNCTGKLLAARSEMIRSLEEAWKPYSQGAVAELSLLKDLAIQSRKAASCSREILYQLFPFCGMSIIFSSSELNKVWRDLSVAGQHYLLSPTKDV